MKDAVRAWQRIPPLPTRVLAAPAVAIGMVLLVWTVGHPAIAVSLSAGLAAGVLWAVGTLLSIVLGIATDDPVFVA